MSDFDDEIYYRVRERYDERMPLAVGCAHFWGTLLIVALCFFGGLFLYAYALGYFGSM